MLNTPEAAVRDFISLQYRAGNSKHIEVLCPYSDLLKIFERIQQQWTSIGDREPYASVLSESKYRMDSINANIDEFHESGRSGMANLKQLSLKNDIYLPNGTLFELGCGVGRSTQHFAPAFESISAWDISKGNLAECTKILTQRGVRNVTLNHVTDFAQYKIIPKHDVFFSEIVIQHNLPPVQYYLIDKIFQTLNPGGIFYFQTITHHETYSFRVSDYLSWQHNQDFEMHALPMRWVLRLIQKNNLVLLDVLKERMGGFNLDSHTFFGIRPA